MLFLVFFSVFVFGLILGSFLNCLVWRLHTGESLWTRSHCPKCLNKISWYDNIPLLSFILLKRRCRHCQKKISWQYFLVEIFSALLFTAAFWHVLVNTSVFINPEQFILFLARDWVFIFALLVIFIFDAKWQEVPMLIVWPASVAIAILNLFLGFNPLTIALSALVASTFFLIQYYATKKRGLGEGDIWIALMMGLFFADLGSLVLAILASYLIGSLISLYFLSSKKKELKSKIALGPFLVLGSLVALFFGKQIIFWYFGLL